MFGEDQKKAAELCDELSKKDIAVGYVLNIERAVGDADIIITTTQAMKFIVKDDWVSKATHITAVGADSPGKEELELSLIERANCLVSDLASQSLEHGEFQRLKTAGLKIRPVELEIYWTEKHSAEKGRGYYDSRPYRFSNSGHCNCRNNSSWRQT